MSNIVIQKTSVKRFPFTVYLEEELRNKVVKLATDNRVSKNRVMVELIRRALEDSKKDK